MKIAIPVCLSCLPVMGGIAIGVCLGLLAAWVLSTIGRWLADWIDVNRLLERCEIVLDYDEARAKEFKDRMLIDEGFHEEDVIFDDKDSDIDSDLGCLFDSMRECLKSLPLKK